MFLCRNRVNYICPRLLSSRSLVVAVTILHSIGSVTPGCLGRGVSRQKFLRPEPIVKLLSNESFH